jgi:putative FmdB family regulatory protein
MPFYEYQCKNCGHDLEAMQKISDSPLKKCPHCGKPRLQRLRSAPVFRLKGAGWYETDFKGDQDNKKNLADRPEADTPKDLPKDIAQDAAKDANGKVKDGNGKDAKSADGAGTQDAAPKDKAADKPADKGPAESPKKAAASGSGKSSARGRAASPRKSPAKRPVKKPAPQAKRRR